MPRVSPAAAIAVHFYSTYGSTIGTISNVATIEKIVLRMRREPATIRFTELLRVCQDQFGEPRQSTGSHIVFKTPWPGDPRINIQDDHGRAKIYQVRQVLLALDKLAAIRGEHT